MGEAIKLVSHDDLPSWSIDNEYIVRGYRAPGGINDEKKKKERQENGSTTAVDGAAKTPGNKLRQRGANTTDDQGTTSDDGSLYYEHNTIRRCWWSIWLYTHNETVNIHTHFWGALVAVIAALLHVLALFDLVPEGLYPITHHSIFYPDAIIPAPKPKSISPLKSWLSLLQRDPSPAAALSTLPIRIASLVSLPATRVTPWLISHQRDNDWKDIVGYATYLLGAITVLIFSATFHTVVCHSRDFSHSCNKLDYIGIVAMIVGSFLPMLHYGFYCHAHLQLFYSLAILTLGGFATYTVLSRKFATPAYRPIRTSVFLALGLSAIFPVAHICAMYGYEAVSITMGVDWIIAGGALYIVGACLYMARVPERFSPGTFDYFGASHQIFHVLILMAAFSHYVCIRRAYTFWHVAENINGGAVCQAFETLRHS